MGVMKRYNVAGLLLRVLVLAMLPALIPPLVPLAAAEDNLSIARQLHEYYLDARPAPDLLPEHSLVAAKQVQAAYVEILTKQAGPRIGYKAGLTGQAAQRRFGVDHPLLGVLLERMLLPAPAQLAVSDGARLLVEADLVVRVADDAINDAKDWAGLLKHLDAVFPFIEIPDLLYSDAVQIDAPLLQAANVGARYGVLGPAITLQAGEDWHRRLSEFQVELRYPDASQAQAEGRALLGHPLAAVEWLRDAVHARGERLVAGDLLSLGSLTPLRPVQAGRLQARYSGLDPQGPVDLVIDFHSPPAAQSATLRKE